MHFAVAHIVEYVLESLPVAINEHFLVIFLARLVPEGTDQGRQLGVGVRSQEGARNLVKGKVLSCQ